MVYAKELTSSVILTPGSLRTGVVGAITASTKPALMSLNAIAGAPVSPRDALYLKTDAALNCMGTNESVLSFVEENIQILLAGGAEDRDVTEAFGCSKLDLNLCRLKGLVGDLQHPEVVQRVGDYTQFKQVVADSVELLAKDCREYVSKNVKRSTTMEAGLSAAEFQTVQNFNHLRRVVGSVFKLDIADGEVYLDSLVRGESSLDDTERGGMNRVFSGVSYSGSQRPFFLKVMPYFVMTMNSPMFLNALSRPRQLSAVTSRPGPMVLPKSTAAQFNLPEGTQVTYHSVSRYGETNQREKAKTPENAGKKPTSVKPPMKFYYSYQDRGVTKMLALDRSKHFYVQLQNRPSLELPAEAVHLASPVQAKYVMFKWEDKSYEYEVNRTRYNLTQAQHQKVLQHNATRFDMADPNAPVHMTFMADGSLDAVMNRLFNDLAARAVSNKNNYKDLLPQGHRERLRLMTDLTTAMKPDFEREQQRIEALRSQLFTEFANGKRGKDSIEDICRTEAKTSFRSLVAARRTGIPEAQSRRLIQEATQEIDVKFEDMYKAKAGQFAQAGAARALYFKKTEPFYTVFKQTMEANRGFIDITGALEKVPASERKVFDAMVTHVHEQMDQPIVGLKAQLKATYWGGVTQHLMDVYYGPEGILKDGSYIGREGLPTDSREFLKYIESSARDLLANPVQVGNRLGKTFANYEFNVSPYYKLPWPNLYRDNDLLKDRRQWSSVRDERTIKPKENPVSIKVEVDVPGADGQPETCLIRMTGNQDRNAKRQEQPTQAPAPQLDEFAAPQPELAGM
jgi:hypothetical protein